MCVQLNVQAAGNWQPVNLVANQIPQPNQNTAPNHD